jgi:nicotinate-nucleotide pyrophosphorylase (carboxylating)
MNDFLNQNDLELEEHVLTSLREDRADKDVTSQALPNPDTPVEAKLIARESGTICGVDLFQRVFDNLTNLHYFSGTDSVDVDLKTEDGDSVSSDQTLATVSGPADSILAGERTALNYLQQLSGVASRTATMVEIAEPHGIDIYDTRKTIPHHRVLQKYAVHCGGGQNHRLNLSEAVMVKDTHKSIAGGLRRYLDHLSTEKPVVVEIHDPDELEQLHTISDSGTDSFDIEIIMLDNFRPEDVEQLVDRNPQSLTVEVSGGIRLDNLERYCRTGADRISVGALTHSFDSLDLSLKFLP